MIFLALLASVWQLSFGHISAGGLQTLLSSSFVPPKQSKLLLQQNAPSPTPILKPNTPAYYAQAKAALIYDVGSGTYLYEKGSDSKAAIASITKLATAAVIMQSHSPDELVEIPDDLPPLGAADQKLGVRPGEKFVLSDLMQALLIYSANDVAYSLAIWHSGDIESFAKEMNTYAKEWGLENSNFVNPAGLDDEGQLSTVKDMQTIASVLLHSADFRDIVRTQKTAIINTNDKPYNITTTNQSLALPYVYGIKTGYTLEAGQNLMLLAQKSGHEIITVVFDSPNRFQESKNMIEYTFNNYTWK